MTASITTPVVRMLNTPRPRLSDLQSKSFDSFDELDWMNMCNYVHIYRDMLKYYLTPRRRQHIRPNRQGVSDGYHGKAMRKLLEFGLLERSENKYATTIYGKKLLQLHHLDGERCKHVVTSIRSGNRWLLY